MIATLSAVVTPRPTAQSTASIRSSCIFLPHCRSPAEMNFLPKPVEARKLGESTA